MELEKDVPIRAVIAIRPDHKTAIPGAADRLNGTVAALTPIGRIPDDQPYAGEWMLVDHTSSALEAFFGTFWIPSGDVEVLGPVA